ncbi:MAG: GNAT family N-acetyltransferase [Mogibacterium sp.]|nr:GNAT family N-acetyltransferase [Mogibacterium sp.]
MKYRELKPDEYGLLKLFTYEAIFIPEGSEPPDRSITEQPELSLYYDGFGSGPADLCMAAEDNGTIAGVAWTRSMDDYGHVDDGIPSLAISLIREYRGKGIGTKLLGKLLDQLKHNGYGRVSLSVQKENYAVRMYEHAGFRTISENDEEFIMVCALN